MDTKTRPSYTYARTHCQTEHDEQLVILSHLSTYRVTDVSNCVSCREASETTCEASAEVNEARRERVRLAWIHCRI